MEVQQFCDRFPKLMHMANADAWASICQYGLLSTQVIVEKLSLSQAEKHLLLSTRRKSSFSREGYHIRDQRPMTAILPKCLHSDITETQWLWLLNSKVFFSPRLKRPTKEDRLQRFLKTYSESSQLVLEFDSARFLNKFHKTASLCHINAGATRSIEHKRGWNTIVPFADYRWSISNDVAELTVPLRVDGVQQLVDRVSIVHPNGREDLVFLREASAS